MKEDVTGKERSPKFNVGEIVYRIDNDTCEELLITSVNLCVKHYLQRGCVEFRYTVLPNPDQRRGELREPDVMLPAEGFLRGFDVDEGVITNDINEIMERTIQKYKDEMGMIAEKIHELEMKLKERGREI
mgnify:CR=1 FL=1